MTFETIIEYLTKVHGSQLESFQLFSRAWNLELESECYTDYATKLELRLRDAAQQIKHRFTEEKKSTTNGKPQLSADEVFQLMGAMLIAEKVKERSPKIFGMMIKTMDRHWTASNIAHEAKLYQERLGEESEAILESDDTVFFAKKQRKISQLVAKPTYVKPPTEKPIKQSTKKKNDRKSSDVICRNFQSGTCRYSPCKFKHVKLHNANVAIVGDERITRTESATKPVDFRYGLLC